MRTFTLAKFARIPWKITKIMTRIIFWLLAILGFVALCVFIALAFYMPSSHVDPATAKLVRTAAAEGKLAYKLTEPKELKALLGPPVAETTVNDGGMQKLLLDWPGVNATFIRVRRFSAPFTLWYVKLGGKSFRIGTFADNFGGRPINIGQGRKVALRNEDDLKKFDTFWGFCEVSLVNLDLTGHENLLKKMCFDSRTEWPEPNKLPEGFNPARLLEEAKKPGLGIRSLHKQGIDGRGVGIAILDQPLLKNHQEYVDRIVLYEEIGVWGMSPKMHGSPVASIAVGKTCGVAPAAALYYYAMRMTSMPDNKIYCDIIDKIIELNESASASERIRVISISTGMFAQQANFARWKQTLKKAEQHGIIVVTCDTAVLNYGTLARVPNKGADDPSSYRRGRYSTGKNILLVPTNRTTASHYGPEVYTYWTEGGMSWAAPYIAGLAALAFQVNPDVQPQTIVEQLVKTATHTKAGPVVNPTGFIKAVQNNKK